MCVQRYYLCAHNLIYVRSMLLTLRCQIKETGGGGGGVLKFPKNNKQGGLLFLGNLNTLPSPRYLPGPPTPLINF